MEATQQYIQRYLSWGFSIIPVKSRDKVPLVEWKQYQSRKPDDSEISEWQEEFWSEGANIGIVCGKVSGNLVVLDFDKAEAFEEFKNKWSHYRSDEIADVTPVIKTTKGYHVYLKVNNVSRSKKPSIDSDIKGEGGYVVAPPSVHKSGVTYKLLNPNVNQILQVNDLAELGICEEPPAKARQVSSDTTDMLRGVSEGQRDNKCIRLAGHFKSQGLAIEETMVLCKHFADDCKPPFPYDQVEKCVKSAYNYENGNAKKRKSKDSDEVPPLRIKKVSVEELDNGFEFEFTLEASKRVVVRVINLRKDSGHNVSGAMDITYMKPRAKVGFKRATINLTSLSSRTQAAQYLGRRKLEEKYKIPWNEIVCRACDKTLARYRTGNEVEVIRSDISVEPLKYLVEPFLPLGVPTIIFGAPGHTKSLVATFLAAIVQVPKRDDSLGLVTPVTPIPVMYLDFENNKDEFTWRWAAMANGIGVAKSDIFYLPCSVPLAEMAEKVREHIGNYAIGLLILDSLVGAAGGNPNDAEPVVFLMNALRTFDGVTTLILAHTSKETSGTKKTPYGSVFYEAFARSVWRCEKGQELSDGEALTTLTNTKANRSSKHAPIKLAWRFTKDTITVKTAAANEADSNSSVTLASSIAVILINGPVKVRALAEMLNKSTETIRMTLKRMEKSGQVAHFPDKTWGLGESEGNDANKNRGKKDEEPSG
jgi:hypothetical protein